MSQTIFVDINESNAFKRELNGIKMLLITPSTSATPANENGGE